MALVTNVIISFDVVVMVAKFFWRRVTTVSIRYIRWLRDIFYHTRVVNC